MSETVSRRSLVRRAAVAAAPAFVPNLLAQSKKMTVGFIGTGGRGNYLMDRLYAGSATRITVLGVCDTYAGNLNRAKDKVSTVENKPAKAYVDFQQLLADPEIQVVVIATP